VSSSYVTAAFPVMAEHISNNRTAAYKETIRTAGRHIIYWSAVILVLTIVLRAHIVRIVLGSGAFNWDDTRVTAAVLAILIISLMAQGIILLASRAFYAAHKSWNPLIVQLGDAGVSVAFAALLLKLATTYPVIRYFIETLFRVSDVPGTQVLFVALGATVGQLVMCVVAMVTLGTVAPGVARTFIRPILVGLGAAILGGTAAYGALTALGNIAPLTSLLAVFTQAAIAGILGLAVSVAILALLEREDFITLISSLKKIRTSRALPPFGSTLQNKSDS
jgi:putative peptidoglycan lipid II flippase